ncbi:hypothetical protein Droror1_Dr00009166 [Drosera rotundifolia]
MIVNGNGLRCMDPQAKEDTRGPEKNKHKWTDDEDDKLVEAMLDIVNSGTQFKTDNGFKPGFFSTIEKSLSISLASAGLKTKPHNECRIKTLKADWAMGMIC